MSIQDFKEVREDRKIIDESMTPADIFALGPVRRVVELRWKNKENEVLLPFPEGVLAIVVKSRNYLAAKHGRTLTILNADGSRHLLVSNRQEIQSQEVLGSYKWFESARNPMPDAFGVIFERADDRRMFQLDISAADGSLLGVYPQR